MATPKISPVSSSSPQDNLHEYAGNLVESLISVVDVDIELEPRLQNLIRLEDLSVDEVLDRVAARKFQ
jgi:hypothetical protein